MSSFLQSVKADLLDRRLLPLVALVAAALVAAIAYAAFGGGSSTATPPAPIPSTRATAATGLTVTSSTSETAVAETTDGTSLQHHGAARNPFTPLPEKKAKAAATSTAATSAGSTSSSSSGSSSSKGSGEAAPAKPTKPTTPAKPTTVYHVAVLFGVSPSTTAGQATELTPYENLKLLTPLPEKQALIVFRGVTAGGKSATFTVVGEAILRGDATCLPSASQCQEIDLKVGQDEQLEYLPPEGAAVIYELRIVSIAASKASTASAASVLHDQSKAGRALLRRAGLVAIPDMRYSTDAGVLVFAPHPHYANAAARRRHSR